VGLLTVRLGSDLLFLDACAPNSAEDDHAQKPPCVCARDGEDDDRDHALHAGHQEKSEADESAEDEGACNPTCQRTHEHRGWVSGLQISITWRSSTAPSTVPLYRWLNMNRVFGWRFFNSVADSQLMWLKTSPGPVASTIAA